MNNSYNYYSDDNYDRVNYDILFGTLGLNNNMVKDPNNFMMNSNINNTMNNMSTNNNLFGPYEGYTKGNMFKNLYQQYKNYKPANLNPKSEEGEALLNLNQMHFAMHEANLLLDANPNDANIMREYVRFRDSYNKLLNEYEKKYGALNVNSDDLNRTPFGWTEEKWPWDRRGL